MIFTLQSIVFFLFSIYSSLYFKKHIEHCKNYPQFADLQKQAALSGGLPIPGPSRSNRNSTPLQMHENFGLKWYQHFIYSRNYLASPLYFENVNLILVFKVGTTFKCLLTHPVSVCIETVTVVASTYVACQLVPFINMFLKMEIYKCV